MGFEAALNWFHEALEKLRKEGSGRRAGQRDAAKKQPLGQPAAVVGH